MKNMNHTTLALVAVLAAAALVIGMVATPAFAGGYDKKDKRYDKKDRYGDSSATITKQTNKQKQSISGFFSEGDQEASNCITVLSGQNSCKTQFD
jgi:Spy/CpxP family protein refolding chaperone